MSAHDLSREQRDSVTETLRAELSADKDVAFAFLQGSFALELPFRDVDLAVYRLEGIRQARTHVFPSSNREELRYRRR